ncbi:MAG: DUF2116 family Zn-ribbon domain-containing protein [Candidatus Thiodiazotropha weberae]|nr:DUF2116 family Zn-ribbon domain-containing protein [Candidatus Thiodiazotropha weberae]
MKNKEILNAADKVKQAYSNRLVLQNHEQMMNREKRCIWCNKPIGRSDSYCSKACESAYKEAVRDWERMREDKEEQRWAK